MLCRLTGRVFPEKSAAKNPNSHIEYLNPFFSPKYLTAEVRSQMRKVTYEIRQGTIDDYSEAFEVLSVSGISYS